MSALDWFIAYGVAALIWALLMAALAGYGAAKNDTKATQGAIISASLSPIWPLVLAFLIGHTITQRKAGQ